MRRSANRMVNRPSSADDLIVSYRKYVYSVASKLINSMSLPATQIDEFVSAGYLGLVEAAQRFNPNAGVNFKNYAYLRIRGAIIDSIRADSELSGKAYKMARAWSASAILEENFHAESLRQKNNNNDAELARVLEFAASGALAFKLSMEDAEEEVAELSSQDKSQEDQLIATQESLNIRALVAQLPEKEKIVIQSYYFENKSFGEIQLENDGMTKSWISRLHCRALSNLKELILKNTKVEDV